MCGRVSSGNMTTVGHDNGRTTTPVNEHPDVTVFIPTWFAGPLLREVLEAVFQQKTTFTFEVLIYDTSSTDETPSIIGEFAKRYDQLRHKTITKNQFSHGRTRQAAAEDARGTVIAYLTQDAVPANDLWLANLVAPILDGYADAVVGKQIPRSDAPPLLKYDIHDTFAGLGSDVGVTVVKKTSNPLTQQEQDLSAFFSDVNSAIRREVLLTTVPFRDIPYAEDQMMGRDILAHGLTKAYSPRGAVIHTNDIALREFKKRLFDETVGLRRVGIPIQPLSRRNVVKATLNASLRQTRRILHDRQYSIQRRCYWIVVNPWLQWQKWEGVRLGSLVDIHSKTALDEHSLESEKARKFGQA